jgi:hypothetical protein
MNLNEKKKGWRVCDLMDKETRDTKRIKARLTK